MTERNWPSRTIDKAPTWCSVDLRDGNQALAVPMSVEEKLEYFDMLVKIGFKEIEIGFPSASQIEFDFTRRLIEENRIPEGVWIQMLVQCKEELIERTFESIKGAPRAIVHLYNSTSPAQRRITFGLDKKGVLDIAVSGTKHVRDRVKTVPGTKIRFEYSPESFSATETDFALEVCEAVGETWGYTEEDPIIFNLPNTVELMMPNQHADQIEWFIKHLKYPKRSIISLHTHNDRGTGIAASELGLLAGATRVEGTLFGNGERTGNVDIVTLALNMFTQGVDPKLDFQQHPRDPRQLREVDEARRAVAPALRRRLGFHGVLRLAPGRDQQGAEGPHGASRRHVGGALLVDRSARYRAELSRDHSHQQPVRQGRRGLCHGAGIRLRVAEGDASRLRAHHQSRGR